MEHGTQRKPTSRRVAFARRRSWCCSFTVPPSSPEGLSVSSRTHHNRKPDAKCHRPHRHKSDSLPKTGSNSLPPSPQSSRSGLNIVGRIDPRRILSPGRVSPIDSDPTTDSVVQTGNESFPVVDSATKSRSESFRAPKLEVSGTDQGSASAPAWDAYDVKLNLKAKNGGVLVLELSSRVLAAKSEVFGALISEQKKGYSLSSSSLRSNGLCRIEVPDVENLGVFRETIELMFEENDNIIKRLMKIGVYRAIDVLEVSLGIKFTECISSCLKYLEAVPWTEEEEEKLKRLLRVFNFDDETTDNILARLNTSDTEKPQKSLPNNLVQSIIACTDMNARNELKSLVKALLLRSSVYEKDQPDIRKEDIYRACQSCLDLLVHLIGEASNANPIQKVGNRNADKPLIERISRHTENINWLLEIMLDWQMAEDFVSLWANQTDLVNMHGSASPMVRYELSRVSAALFIAMGTRRLQCRSEARTRLLQAWFSPMLADFGWLQRCKKGLDVRLLEEALGQTLLTLPLKQQYALFMEWFRHFSKHGSECPNLSKAFQIWWRRSFLRGSETQAIESR